MHVFLYARFVNNWTRVADLEVRNSFFCLRPNLVPRTHDCYQLVVDPHPDRCCLFALPAIQNGSRHRIYDPPRQKTQVYRERDMYQYTNH